MKRKLLKSLVLVMAMVIFCFAVTTTASADYDYDYTITADTTINVDIISNKLTYIKFVPEVSGIYTITSYASQDTYGYLYDEDLEQITYDDDDGDGNNFLISHTLRKGVTYYFGVRFYDSGRSGNYDVSLTLDEIICDHKNTTLIEAGVKAGCYTDGTEDTIKCNDCETTLGGGVISFSHTDENDDGECDACQKTMHAYKGSCGGNLVYDEYDCCSNYDGAAKFYRYPDGTLEIFGEGEIEEEAFWCSSNIKNVIINEGITKIRGSAFADCYDLQSVTILNPECVISDSSNTIDSSAIIYGISGSTAESYAYTFGRTFRIYCPHESTREVAGRDATCYVDGYTSSVVCNNCESTISGATTIKASHSDKNDDGVCDICKKSMPTSQGSCGGYVCDGGEYDDYDGSVRYYQYADGTVEIFGDGEIRECAFEYDETITDVKIYEGITRINGSAFQGCDSLESISILNSSCEICGSASTIYYGATIYGYSGSTAEYYANEYDRDFEIYCPHSDTTDISAKSASCYVFGNTQGVKCNDCGRTLSGYEVILPSHTDNNEDEKCDICQKAMPTSEGSCGGFVVETEDDDYDDCWDDDCCDDYDDTVYDGSARYYKYADGTLEIFGDGEIKKCAFESYSSIYNVVVYEGIDKIGEHAFNDCDNIRDITILNPDCTIYDSRYTIDSSATIVGLEDSTAESYANSYSRDFYIYCLHSSTKTIAEVPASCYFDGVAQGVKCNDCGRTLSGLNVIEANHKDENETGKCDLCKKAMPTSQGTCGGYIVEREYDDDYDHDDDCWDDDWDDDCYDDDDYDGSARYYRYADGTIEIFGKGTIKEYAFDYDSSIKNVIIYEGITKIDDEAFDDCYRLKSITILNPDCEIYDHSYTIYSGATIYGHEGSTAETYADEYDRNFIVYCPHKNTSNIAEKSPTCYYFGNTAGIKCDDCGVILSGCEDIVATHTDNNNTGKCDICKKVMPIETGYCGGLLKEDDDYCDDEDCYGEDDYDGSARYYKYADGTLEIFGKGEIMEYAFEEDDDIENVIIYEGITGIGYEAFTSCNNLETLTIPDSVTYISGYILSDYWGGREMGIVIFANKNSYAAAWAEDKEYFYALLDGTEEENTASGKIGKFTWSVNKITGVFELVGAGKLVDFTTTEAPWDDYKPYITSLILPEGLTNISHSSFESCARLKSVIIPGSVTSIGGYAFNCCFKLETVEIPGTVETIGEYAFCSCTSLKNLTIGDGVKEIAFRAFSGCGSIETVVVPGSVSSLSSYSFEDCSSLKNVTLGNGIESLYYTFNGCGSLETITIPYTVTSISSGTFSYCGSFKEIIIYSMDCEISNTSGLNFNHTIYGFIGSTAEAFADENAIPFVDVETIHSHNYEEITKREYCSYKQCYCGKKQITEHIDTNLNAICDNCKKTTNGIDINETLSFNTNEYIYIPFTAAKGGQYTISFDKEIGSMRFYNEDKSDSQSRDEYIEENKYMFELEKGQKGYWYFYAYNDDTDGIAKVNVSLTFTESHVHNLSEKVTKKATCTTNGSKVYSCACGYSYTETLWSTGHNIGSWYISQYGSCSETTILSRDCSKCDYVERMKFPASGEHTEEDIIVRATDTHEGSVVTMCSVCNKKLGTRKIPMISSVKLSSSKVVYNGKTRTPTVTVKDANGDLLVKDIDYTVSYASGRKTPGTYKVTVKFKGDYSGTEKLNFTIVPEKVETISYSAASTTSIKLTWSEVEGATDYRVYIYSASKDKYVSVAFVTGATSYTVTGRSAGTTYKFKVRAYTELSNGDFVYSDISDEILASTKPAAPTITKISSTTKGKAVVEWSNVSGESGYQLYYSTSKTGTYKKVNSYSTNVVKGSKSSLTSGKTIYFKVRAYKKVDGKTIYGDWSAIKSVKIK